MILGEKLKQALSTANVNNTAAADFIGISEGNLYKLFKKESFELDYIRKASKLTGQPISYFIDEDSQISEISVNNNIQSQTGVLEYLKEIEGKVESRYEKIIQHYEMLLNRYEGKVSPFKTVSRLSRVRMSKRIAMMKVHRTLTHTNISADTRSL